MSEFPTEMEVSPIMQVLIALLKKIRSLQPTAWAQLIGGLLHLIASVIFVLAQHGWL